MKVASASSQATDPKRAVAELKTRLAGVAQPKLVLAFATSTMSHEVLARELSAAFPGAVVAGCSTAGELVNGDMLKGSLVAMALSSELVQEAYVATAPGSDGAAVDALLGKLEAKMGRKTNDVSYAEHVGLVLVDGVNGGEEAVMDRLGTRASFRIVGGSAADELKFVRSWVFGDGEAVTGTALVIVKPAVPFDIVKTQSARVLEPVLTPTKVSNGRTVHELDGQPALVAYAKALGCTPAEAVARSARHPLGLLVDGEPYLRTLRKAEGNDLHFYCALHVGVPLSMLEVGDIVADTRHDLAADEKAKGPIEALINFHCIMRTLQLEAENQTKQYGALFERWPSVGFSTYGEQYAGHINQTSTMVVFRKPK